jgi:bifunctional UDP-N-acetylglucosamine pyrophosphorylase/glucosamine-1-phosphate N-acetyltransferase
MNSASAAPVTARPLTVVVLAAGQGKRMHSDRPKVLQPLAGEPLLGHVLATAKSLQPAAIHVVYGHGGDAVRAAFPDPALHWALQSEQKGTGHALQQAMPGIVDGHDVLVLFGDVPLVRGETLRELAALPGGGVALLSVALEDPAGYGRILRDGQGRVLGIVEHRDADTAQREIRECNTGVMVAPAARLRDWLARLRNDNAQGEYYLTDVIAMAAGDGVAVQALVTHDAFAVLGVNDRLQLAQLEAVVRRQRAEALLLAGATLADPARFDQRGHVTVGRDVFIDVNVVFEGEVTLGDRVHVGPHCVLRNVTVGAGTRIDSHCVLTEARVAADCIIGPYARLRPGTELADGVHIGNFVEVKNSLIGAGSKANHLTYLGDATVGSGVNVGAGTITCNYDGANKWRTEIGDDAFIGSNTMLVAPLKVGAGATTGAGSTLTRDAPPNQLTVARPRQATIPGWKRPTKGGTGK